MNQTEKYISPTGMNWEGAPSKITPTENDICFAYFNNPIGSKKSDCIVEVWKKNTKKFLGITYKSEINVVAVFWIKRK